MPGQRCIYTDYYMSAQHGDKGTTLDVESGTGSGELAVMKFRSGGMAQAMQQALLSFGQTAP